MDIARDEWEGVGQLEAPWICTRAKVGLELAGQGHDLVSADVAFKDCGRDYQEFGHG